MKTIKNGFILSVIMILFSCESSHEILENNIENKNDIEMVNDIDAEIGNGVEIYWKTVDKFSTFQIQVNSKILIITETDEYGIFQVNAGDSITVSMSSGDVAYSHVGVYGYMGTLVEDECVDLNCAASVTFIVPYTIETLNILGTGE